MNILIGLIPSLFFGTMPLLMGHFGGSARQQNVGIALGAGLISLLALPFLTTTWTPSSTGIGIAMGLAWAAGQFFQIRAFKFHGVSRTLPMSTGIQLAINAIAGVVLFGEWATTPSATLGVLALGSVVLGVASTSWREMSATTLSAEDARGGLISTIFAGSMFGIYPTVLRYAEISAVDAVGPMGIGLVLGALGLAVAIPGQKGESLYVPTTAKQGISGGSWAVGNVVMLYSTSINGVATGFALSQLGVIIATLGGVYILGEKRSSREMTTLFVGVAFVVLGGLLLGLAKSFDVA